MTNWGPSGLAMPGQSFADSKRDGSVSGRGIDGHREPAPV